MSLSSALFTAQSALRSTAKQTSVVSRNITEANNPDYNRRTAVLGSTVPGVQVAEVQRAANDQLFKQNLLATSAYAGQSTLSDALDRLNLAVNGADNGDSPSAAMAKLQEALQLYASTPSNATLAQNAVDAARGAVGALNGGTTAIGQFRADADSGIAEAVSNLNRLLADLKTTNDAVVSGTRSGRDVTDALDARDAILKQVAEYVPISAITRSDNDIVLVTGDGATLFERIPRAVSFTPSAVLATGAPGNAVTVDGVPLKIAPGQALATGKIAGLLQMRDGAANTLQSQLDEMARGLISAFAETDQTGGAAPARTGLFTWSGGSALPSASLTGGLAGTIAIDAAFDTSQGGSALLLRDGGANGAAFKANTGNNASFSRLLIGYGDKIAATMSFDPAAGLGTSQSLADFASNSIGWLQGLRQTATAQSENKQALAVRTAEALSNATGVNVDEEMALLLDLEHTYQASARLLQVVDEMLATLLNAVN